MKKKMIISVILISILLAGCNKDTYGENDFKEAQNRAISIILDQTFSQPTVIDSTYNKKSKTYTIYLSTNTGKYKKVDIDMTSKDEYGNFNHIFIDDWTPTDNGQ